MDPADAPRFCGILQGDWGFSTVFKDDEVADIVGGAPWQLTGKLMFWACVMVPIGADCGRAGGHARGDPDGPVAVDLLAIAPPRRRNTCRA
jgi:peptide/nickel transport system permease protein